MSTPDFGPSALQQATIFELIEELKSRTEACVVACRDREDAYSVCTSGLLSERAGLVRMLHEQVDRAMTEWFDASGDEPEVM